MGLNIAADVKWREWPRKIVLEVDIASGPCAGLSPKSCEYCYAATQKTLSNCHYNQYRARKNHSQETGRLQEHHIGLVVPNADTKVKHTHTFLPLVVRYKIVITDTETRRYALCYSNCHSWVNIFLGKVSSRRLRTEQ